MSDVDLKVAARIYEVFDEGDVGALDAFVDPNLRDHNPVPGAATGIDGMRTLVAAVRDGFTQRHHQILYQATTDDGCVVIHWRMTALHTGEWFGTPASGRQVSFTGTDIVRVSAGMVTEIRHVEELLQLSQQIGGQE